MTPDAEPLDVVGTVRRGTWSEWAAEADDPLFWRAGGAAWWSRHPLALRVSRGSRFYVVSEGRLRLYVTLSIGVRHGTGDGWVPLMVDAARPGETGIVPVTLDCDVRGFRGLRRRWWPYEAERAFPDWRTAGVPGRPARRGNVSG